MTTLKVILKVIEKKKDTSDVLVKPIEDEKWSTLSNIGYPKYQISTHARVINVGTKRFLEGSIKKDGYRRVQLSKEGKSKIFLLHRLVAAIFIPVENTDKLTVDHIDRNRDNNVLCNLRWATTSEQALNQTRSGQTSKRRPINQYDIQGNFIKRWDKASDINDAGWHHIQESRNERRSSGGYLWRYDDMEEMIGEIWRSIPYDEFTDCFASNKGRIKRPRGTNYIRMCA